MEELPLEITASILSGLPKISRPQLREVCKTWRNLLPKPMKCLLFGVSNRCETEEIVTEFYSSEQNNNDKVSISDQLMYHHSLILLPRQSITKFIMVGSCNGLVCYAGYAISRSGYFLTLKQVYICDPVTREEIQLHTEGWDGDFWAEPGIGFDYNDSSKEYKVVRILCDHRCRGGWIQVYTLKKDSTLWKNKTCRINVDIASYLSFSPSAGVFSGGALHWIDQDSIKRTVVAFDLEHETFELLPSVPSDVVNYANVGLMVLGGNLCVLDIVPGEHVTVWEWKPVKCMEKDYVCPWVTMFSIAWSWFEFAKTKRDKYFLWYNVILSCYDHETKTLRKLDESLKKFMDTFTCWLYITTQAIPFVIPIMEERS